MVPFTWLFCTSFSIPIPSGCNKNIAHLIYLQCQTYYYVYVFIYEFQHSFNILSLQNNFFSACRRLVQKIIKKINNQIRYRNIFNVIKYKTNNTSLFDQLKNNRKIVERGKIDTFNTRIHGNLHCWLGTGTSINKVAGLSQLYGPNSFLYHPQQSCGGVTGFTMFVRLQTNPMSYDNLSCVSQNLLKFYQQLTGEERRIPFHFLRFSLLPFQSYWT